MTRPHITIELASDLDAKLRDLNIGTAHDAGAGWIRVQQTGRQVYSLKVAEARRYLSWLTAGNVASVNAFRAAETGAVAK